ncbi:MAG: biotin carboxylase N-terminal domain-containing protein [Pseudomonadota bacterium]
MSTTGTTAGSLACVLIANRGEIACRVARTARAMGLRTVAVYSDADADAPHVQACDDRQHVGASAPAESYLNAERILAAARAAGADAIHPGYGFLSENAAFARAVEAGGLTFIGPPAAAVDIMGDKARAKRHLADTDVPCIPGYDGDDQSDAALVAAGASVGYPLMIKAAAGGGGRGMRLVDDAASLAPALALARAEARGAFGDDTLILERALIGARHVEVQVFADRHGNVVHLGERDCSVQRRHQKVIEEAPCPVMTDALRARMGEAACNVARAVDYVGAGTVEFLLTDAHEFFFLEMNTRLQVEHPVTESITGFDLVEWQLRVAAGEALPAAQSDIRFDGHAIEVRLCAEDPAQDFIPSTGILHAWHAPERPGIRIDTGVSAGSEVSPFYDSMVAKVIASGADREQARRRLVEALGELGALGLATNRDFLLHALEVPAFARGEATTAFIEATYGRDGFSLPPLSDAELAVAATTHFLALRARAYAASAGVAPELLDWSSTGELCTHLRYLIDDVEHHARVLPLGGAGYRVDLGDRMVEMTLRTYAPTALTVLLDGQSIDTLFHLLDEATLLVALPRRTLELRNLSLSAPETEEAGGGGVLRAPMHGQLLEIDVKAGEVVTKGQRVAVLEAMKMQHELLAGIGGVVASITAMAGTQVAADDLILEITPDTASEE